MDKEVMETVQKQHERLQKEKREQEIDQAFLKDYEICQRQEETRYQARIDEQRKRTLKQRLVAIAVAAAIGLGVGVYTVDKNGVYRGEEEQPENNVRYEDFIEYVNEMREEGIDIEITQESYANYVQEMENSTSRGSR